MNTTLYRPLNLAEAMRDIRNELRWAQEFEATGRLPIAGGAAGAWTFTNQSRTDMLNGTMDFDTNTFLCALFLSTSNLGASTTT